MDTTVEITAEALAEIKSIRAREPEPDALALGLRIAGVSPQGFRYETAFVPVDQLDPGDHREDHDGLVVAIPPDSVSQLTGAVLALSSDPRAPGLVLRNPNSPTPGLVPGGDLELTGTVEERIVQLLEQRINPAIAAHGGYAELAGVDGSTAFLQMGGGCQGCGLAAMTLRQGIEAAILEAVPEVTDVVDVTDHAAGINPYY